MLALVKPASVSMQHLVSEGPAKKIHLCNKFINIATPTTCLTVCSDDFTLAWLHLEVFCFLTLLLYKQLCPLKK